MKKVIDPSVQGNVLALASTEENTRKLYIESYGCQMNFSDSEIVASILAKEGFDTTQVLDDADLVLINTCSIREKAETTVRKRLQKFNAVKKTRPHIRSAQTMMFMIINPDRSRQVAGCELRVG